MITVAKRKKSRKDEQIRAISEEIREVSEALEVADAGFNEVSDDDLLEAIIYERSALRARYSFLIKELRRIEST